MADNGSVEYHPMLRDLPKDELPRERLALHGSQALSNSELLAILLRVGVEGENVKLMSERLLAKYNGLAGLWRAPLDELIQEKGLGPAKAITLKAALEIGRRLLTESPDDRPQVRSPADAANLLMIQMMSYEQEHLQTILLDSKNRVLGVPTVYKGSVNSAQVRVGELFREAIRKGAVALIVAHNHPSGDPTPSSEDVLVTREIVQAGELLNISVLDHVVIGRQKYVSLKERGLGFG